MTQHLTDFSALQSVLENSFPYVIPEKREEFERSILDAQLTLIAHLSHQTNTYCNGGWEEIENQWRGLFSRYQTLRENQQLLQPADWKEFEAAIRFAAWQGTEADLEELRKAREKVSQFPRDFFEKSSPKETLSLIETAEKRIRERLSDPERVMHDGEAAYERNKKVWDKKYPGKFIAIWKGAIVAHGRDEAEVARKLSELQRARGRFRAYVVEIGVPKMTMRGPRGGTHRTTRRKGAKGSD